MATLEWQTPPFFGRTLGRFGRQGSFDIVHEPAIPGIHEGKVTAEAKTGTERYGGLYWSKYEFQIKPDDPSDNGPWKVLLLFTLAGELYKISLLDRGTARGILAARATITRLSDGARVYSKLLRDSASAGSYNMWLGGGSFLGKDDIDDLTLEAGEYRLDLITYASVYARAKRWSINSTRAKLLLQSPIAVEVTLYL